MFAIAVAAHGLVFAVGSLTLARADNPALQGVAEAYYFLVIVPALFLSMPFDPILWRLHLMENPGWFAWPKPLGFALVYGTWFSAFLGASFVRIRR